MIAPYLEHDPEKTGQISFENFKSVITELYGNGEEFTDEEVKQIIGAHFLKMVRQCHTKKRPKL